uniref:Uncharacterized protein n=1 Tax=Parascaris equorum TaxID=6256 RepID=A0A914R183_PAREQ
MPLQNLMDCNGIFRSYIHIHKEQILSFRWQKRERILALSEKTTASDTKSASAAKGSGGRRFLLRASASTSNTTSSAVIIAQFHKATDINRLGTRLPAPEHALCSAQIAQLNFSQIPQRSKTFYDRL